LFASAHRKRENRQRPVDATTRHEAIALNAKDHGVADFAYVFARDDPHYASANNFNVVLVNGVTPG
jgi:hypothetical protein